MNEVQNPNEAQEGPDEGFTRFIPDAFRKQFEGFSKGLQSVGKFVESLSGTNNENEAQLKSLRNRVLALAIIPGLFLGALKVLDSINKAIEEVERRKDLDEKMAKFAEEMLRRYGPRGFEIQFINVTEKQEGDYRKMRCVIIDKKNTNPLATSVQETMITLRTNTDAGMLPTIRFKRGELTEIVNLPDFEEARIQQINDRVFHLNMQESTLRLPDGRTSRLENNMSFMFRPGVEFVCNNGKLEFRIKLDRWNLTSVYGNIERDYRPDSYNRVSIPFDADSAFAQQYVPEGQGFQMYRNTPNLLLMFGQFINGQYHYAGNISGQANELNIHMKRLGVFSNVLLTRKTQSSIPTT